MRKAAFILLLIYVFTLPWDNILQFGEPIGSAGRVAGLIALGGCILVSFTGRMRRLHVFHIAAAIYLGIVALSIFWTADPEYTPHATRAYLQSAMVIWLIWELGSNRSELFHLAAAYLAGACVGALSVFRTFSTTTVMANATEARFTPDGWNSNDIALVLALAMPFALFFVSRRDHWITKWLGCGYLILGPMAIVLTSSRAGLTVAVIAFSALPIFLKRQTAVTKLGMLLVLVCAWCLALHYTPQQSQGTDMAERPTHIHQ